MFTATDAIGNSSVCFAQVDILDNTAPTISMDAQDITVSCDGAGNFTALLSWLNNHGGAVASDVCGDLTWSNDFSGLSDLCGYTGTTSVVFTATDACGNTSTTDGVFTIQDVSPPTITVPVPITVSCGNSLNSVIVTNWLNSAIGSDVCSDVTISNDYPVGAAGPATCTVGPLTVTWTVTDGCGLTSTATSTISTQDA